MAALQSRPQRYHPKKSLLGLLLSLGIICGAALCRAAVRCAARCVAALAAALRQVLANLHHGGLQLVDLPQERTA